MFVPAALSYDYSFNCIPLVESVLDLRNLWSILWLAGLVYFLARNLTSQHDQDAQLLTVSVIGWTIIPFLPSSQVFFLASDMLTESSLYVPSVGFCLAVVYLLHRGSESGLYDRRTFLYICLALLLLGCATTYRRNPDWDNSAVLSARHAVLD